jgi:tRNA (Thr-GGU) A37 N-methylase
MDDFHGRARARAHRRGHAELDALGARLRVTDLEALDGTPVVDVKPVLRSIGER